MFAHAPALHRPKNPGQAKPNGHGYLARGHQRRYIQTDVFRPGQWRAWLLLLAGSTLQVCTHMPTHWQGTTVCRAQRCKVAVQAGGDPNEKAKHTERGARLYSCVLCNSRLCTRTPLQPVQPSRAVTKGLPIRGEKGYINTYINTWVCRCVKYNFIAPWPCQPCSQLF